ncbi:MAG: DUF192 domain-containing protein [Dehalococcoidia bacterium]
MRRYFYLVILASLLACGSTATPSSLPTATNAPTVPPTPIPSPTPVEVVLVSTPAPSPTPTTTPSVPTTVPTPKPTPTPTPAVPLVNIGDATFTVDLATTAEQRARGLSGRDPLAPGTGMLFVFPAESRFVFWMKEMRFPLDIVWINAECQVVDITLNAPKPAPDESLADLPRFSPSQQAQYVLEIHAGEAAAKGVSRNDPVAFAGTLTGEYGC